MKRKIPKWKFRWCSIKTGSSKIVKDWKLHICSHDQCEAKEMFYDSKNVTKGHLSCLAWLCVEKAYGYFLFFLNEFIQSEDNIYTSEGDGEKKQNEICKVPWPSWKKVIVYFLWITQCPKRVNIQINEFCVVPNFLFREKGKCFPSISLLHNKIKANRKENSAYQNSPLGNQWLPFYTLFVISFRVSHLILSFELIKVCLNVTDISKFPVI